MTRTILPIVACFTLLLGVTNAYFTNAYDDGDKLDLKIELCKLSLSDTCKTVYSYNRYYTYRTNSRKVTRLNLNIPIDESFHTNSLTLKVTLSNNNQNSIYKRNNSLFGFAPMTSKKERPPKRFLLASLFTSEEQTLYDDNNIGLFWTPVVDVYMLADDAVYSSDDIPAILSTDQFSGKYFPAIQPLPVSQKHNDIEITKSTTSLPLTIRFRPSSADQVGIAINKTASIYGSLALNYFGIQSPNVEQISSEDAIGRGIKHILLTTAMVVFFILKIKNLYSYWMNIGEELVGVSVTSVVYHRYASIISSIYLFYEDKSTESFFVIILMIIIARYTFSKISEKHPRIGNSEDEYRILGVRIKDSYSKSLTGEYDKKALAKLKVILRRAIIGYCCFSFLFVEKSGLIDWILKSLYFLTDNFGFLLSVPQIYVNYELKSVAHLPWDYLICKNLYTVLFAYIKSDLLSIWGLLFLLRDTTIFAIYVYQHHEYSKFAVKIEEVDDDDE